jgi:hypothetical protein
MGNKQLEKPALPPLEIPNRLTYKSVHQIRVPLGDKFKDLGLDEVLALIEPVVLAQIDRIWTARNEIDAERGGKTLKFQDLSLLQVLRWHLRGMDVDLAVRKVRTDISHKLNLIALKKADDPVIEGFKAGDRVVLIGDHPKYEHRQGWEGTVHQVQPNRCLVVFDLDPTTSDEYLKTHDIPYSALHNPSKRQPPSKPQKKAKSAKPKKSQTIDELPSL